MKNNIPETRADKLKFLRALMNGDVSAKDLMQPVSRIVFIDNGKVFAYQDANGHEVLNPEIPLEQFNRQYDHSVEVFDYSKPHKNV